MPNEIAKQLHIPWIGPEASKLCPLPSQRWGGGNARCTLPSPELHLVKRDRPVATRRRLICFFLFFAPLIFYGFLRLFSLMIRLGYPCLRDSSPVQPSHLASMAARKTNLQHQVPPPPRSGNLCNLDIVQDLCYRIDTIFRTKEKLRQPDSLMWTQRDVS
jgi:hypothetical protein